MSGSSSSRVRDIGRQYPSGSNKRKAKEDRLKKTELVISKTRKMTDYFTEQRDNGDTNKTESEKYTATIEADVETVQQEKETVEEDETSTTIFTFSNDLGMWPKSLSETDREYWIQTGSNDCQHSNSNFTQSKRLYEGETTPRTCHDSYFHTIHRLTKKQYARKWLCYSESKGRLFCFPCKVMACSGSESQNKLVKEGFNDWKNANNLLRRHEESNSHQQHLIELLMRKKSGGCVDSQLVNQIEEEHKYWSTLLERIIEVVKFLAERGLAFRGNDEKIGSHHNGNYLGLLELLAKFDPFMAEHIKAHANKGKGHTSYLSKTICEEFISLIGSSVHDSIICELKNSKFYTISLDSTPDISNIDQLTLIVRYVLPTGPVERFIKFLDMDSHNAEHLQDKLLTFLNENGIDIGNCRGQSYDNASNMSGRYNGLQARIKQLNEFAEYVPCFAHSLNLVGKCAAECCEEANIFFSFVENIYTFFSASTNRWSLLTAALSNGDQNLKIKRMSDTRWSARADSTKALFSGYSSILQVLDDIVLDNQQKAECRQQARGLFSTMTKLETGIMIIFWNQILQRFQLTSACLQSSGQDLNSACALYESTYGYIESLRSTYSDIEKKAIDLTETEEYEQQRRRKRQRNRIYDDECGTSSGASPSAPTQTPSQKFERTVFFVIIDNLLVALSKRQAAYEKLNSVFGFLHRLQLSTRDEIVKNSFNLVQMYPKDLELSLSEELLQFTELLKSGLSSNIGKTDVPVELQYYQLLTENSLDVCFPNLDIALRIYLSMMVTNCSAERSFSKLKRIKNELRNSMGKERLNYLSLISIENQLMHEIDIKQIIRKFAHQKSRRRNIV